MGEVVQFPGPRPIPECAGPPKSSSRQRPSEWRPMTDEERNLALAFQAYPELLNLSPFAEAMLIRAIRGMPITERQAEAIRDVARSYCIRQAL